MDILKLEVSSKTAYYMVSAHEQFWLSQASRIKESFIPSNSTKYCKSFFQAKKRYKVNWGDEPPDRSKMTMRDLIHWNPSRNPMK
jgi:hypothetical protein